MARPKKEYTNIFARMINQHNTVFVPFFKSIKITSGPFKLKVQRILNVRDKFEEGRGLWDGSGNRSEITQVRNSITEYLILNQFLFSLLDKDKANSAMELIKTNDKDNMHIGAAMIYQFIEDKKIDILIDHKISEHKNGKTNN